MMQDDDEYKLDRWHIQKKKLTKRTLNFNFQEREIWLCAIGINIGDEQNGGESNAERPVLVFKKFSKESFLGIPLTSNKKNDLSKFYMNYALKDKDGALLLSQIRLLSPKRFSRYMAKMSEGDFKLVQEKLKNLLF